MEEKRLLKKKLRSKEEGNLEQLSHYCRELGEYYSKTGKYKDALLQYQEEEIVNESLGNNIAVAVSNRMIGEIYCDLGEFEEALKYQEKHLDIAKMENNVIEEQRALANIGRTYFCKAESLSGKDQPEYHSSLSSAKKAYMKSLEVCESLKGIGVFQQMEMRARLLMNIGLVLECQEIGGRAVEYIEKAIQIGKQHELWEELCRCYSALGMLHHRSGDHTRALKNLNLALEVAERLDSRVRSSCDVLISKAEVLIRIADFGGAKQALLKAYKLRTPDERDRSLIERNLRIVATICQTEERVLFTPETDYGKLKSLYETLGDGSAAVQNYKKAIEFYLKMLMCAEKAGESGHTLCPIYFSLSQTYKDDGQYELALEYSNKELDLWLDVPQEACKTSLNIAEILELKKAPYIEVAGSYLKAKEFAMKAHDWKLLGNTLRCLQNYQNNIGFDDLADDTKKELDELRQIHNIESSSEDEDGTEEDSQTIGTYINLDELSESESDGEEVGILKDGNADVNAKDNSRRTRRRATCKGMVVRRNEKGETGLHRACITGNVALARSLIDRGHPINIRDHCGWTPLHEACNHGHDEVVSLLIEKGAQVNDRGGTHCGGVTPIHDAASCGNLSIIKLLLAAGASVLSRTDKGETPLDCLRSWYRRVKNEIDLYTKEEYESVENLLRKDLEKVGQEVSPIATIREGNDIPESGNIVSRRNVAGESQSSKEKKGKLTSRRTFKENTSRWASSNDLEDMLSSDDEPLVAVNNSGSSDDEPLRRKQSKIPAGDSQSHTAKSGNVRRDDESSSSEYIRTIASLKNRQSLLTLNTRDNKRSTTIPKERGPLVGPDEVLLDDWLEDDLGQMRPAKRTKKCESLGSRENLSVGREGRVTTGTSRSSLSLSGELSQELPEELLQVFSEGDNYDIEEFTQVQQNDGQIAQEEVPTHSSPPLPSIHSSSRVSDGAQQSGIQLVKVEVEGTLLLVPLPSIQDSTFESLAKEVTRRYYEFKGVRLELSLHTKDGALFSKNDPISLLSSLDESNRTLIARVTSLDLPPISDSYVEACSACKIESNPSVKEALETCQITHSLILEDLYLKSKEFTPILKAISHRCLNIRSLSFNGNEIGDKGVKMLSESLSSLSNLLTLDLSLNNITAVGMSELASLFSSRSGTLHNPPLQMLTELKLAYNPLRDASVTYLTTFLNGLISLTSLSLRDCYLSSFGLDGHDDINPFCLDSVEHLDVSFNPLGAEGVAAFLRSLQPPKIKVLNVGWTLGRHHRLGNQAVRKVAREVALFLDRDEFNRPNNLTELDLSQTQLTDSDVCELLRGLEGAPHLEKLKLECNPDLTSVTLRRLLQQGSWPDLKLDFGGCPKILDYMENDGSVVYWMDQNNRERPSLPRSITLSVGEHISSAVVNKMIFMWNKILGSDAFVEQEMFGYLKLGVKTN